MMLLLVLCAATLKSALNEPQSIDQTLSQEKRGYEALNKMMDNIQSIQSKTRGELAAMEKTDFFKLPAKPSSLLEGLPGTKLNHFDAEREQKELAEIGAKFQSELAAIHSQKIRPSSFLEEAPDATEQELDDDMNTVHKQMAQMQDLQAESQKRVEDVKKWAANMHKDLAADEEKNKEGEAKVANVLNEPAAPAPTKASSFVEINSAGSAIDFVMPDPAKFDPNKKIDIAAMHSKVEAEKEAADAAKQKFQDSLEVWKSAKLSKDVDAEEPSSLLETSSRTVQQGREIAKLHQFVAKSPLFAATSQYVQQPTSSLLQNGHSSEQIADLRGLVQTLKHVPDLHELDGGMGKAQAGLTKVQTELDADLERLDKKIRAQAEKAGVPASSLVEYESHWKKLKHHHFDFANMKHHHIDFKPSPDLLAEQADLLKTKAITMELHKKAVAARSKLQADFKAMNDRIKGGLMNGLPKDMISLTQKGDDDEDTSGEHADEEEPEAKAQDSDEDAAPEAPDEEAQDSDEADSFAQTKELRR